MAQADWPDGPVRLRNVRVPRACVHGIDGPVADDLIACDLTIAEGRIGSGGGAEVDLGGAIVLPGFVDCHTHLDKGHIWPRCPNPDGTFEGALAAVPEDRAPNWTQADIRARMEFALRAAHAHGTTAIRTHVDSGPRIAGLKPADLRTEGAWEAFADARAAWAGRIALQGAALTTLEEVGSPNYADIFDLVASHGGIVGAVAYPLPDMPARLDRFLALAARHGMNADFHADETLDPSTNTLGQIAEAVIRNRFEGRVLCGHCCSLSVMAPDVADRTMDLVAEAGLDIVALPLCNLYLQDRRAGRTPRYRGVTLVHELAAHGVNVSFASDNTRDPFYAYGDLDMAEVLREATRIAHLDHPVGDWPAAFGRNPARAMGLDAGVIAPGAPADLVIFPGVRGWTELGARPHGDRIVLRGGRPIDARPPGYTDLDALMEPT